MSWLIRWPKQWSFSFSTSPSNEYSGLISFRIDWFDLFAVQETLKSLLQHLSCKASILQYSAFFMIQLSHLYMTTGKPQLLTIWTIVGKVMCLLFNMLSRFVITFLLRSKCLNFMAAVTICSDFGAQENKACLCYHFSPIYLLQSDRARCHDLGFDLQPTILLNSLISSGRIFLFVCFIDSIGFSTQTMCPLQIKTVLLIPFLQRYLLFLSLVCNGWNFYSAEQK